MTALLQQAACAVDEEDMVRPAHRTRGRVSRHNTELLRRWLIDIPARLVKGGRQLRLRFAVGMGRKRALWAAYHRLRLLSPPTPA